MSRATEMQGFLPDDYVELRTQRRTNILWALVFLVVAGSIGWAYMIAQKKVQMAQETNRRISEEFAAQSKPIELFKSLQEEQKKLNQKAELVGSLGERVNRTNILAELTNRLPSGVYLVDFSLDGKKRADGNKTAFDRAVTAGQPKPILYDVSMKLRGLAYTNNHVAEYMATLAKSPLFKEVVFVLTEDTVYKDIKLRAFELEIALDPAADTRTLGNATTKPATQPAGATPVEPATKPVDLAAATPAGPTTRSVEPAGATPVEPAATPAEPATKPVGQ